MAFDNGGRQWVFPEMCVLSEGFNAGLTDPQIVEKLAQSGFIRTVRAVHARRVKVGLLRQEMPTKIEQTAKGDLAFKRAMLKAIKSGRETAIIGVVKDKRPLMVKPIYPEPKSSGCSSAARMCEEAAVDTHRIW